MQLQPQVPAAFQAWDAQSDEVALNEQGTLLYVSVHPSSGDDGSGVGSGNGSRVGSGAVSGVGTGAGRGPPVRLQSTGPAMTLDPLP